MKNFEPVRAGRLYEQIVAQIEANIVSGVLKAGERFPPERALAEQFGVSRNAVREAVKVLREKGLAEIRPGRGVFVANGTDRAMRESLSRMVRIVQGEGVESLVEVREMLEPALAALAARRRNPEHLSAMRTALAASHAATTVEEFIEADLDFHLAVAEAVGNEVMLALIDSIGDLMRGQRLWLLTATAGTPRGYEFHHAVLDAITRQDADGAREAMQAHMQQIRADSQLAPGAA